MRGGQRGAKCAVELWHSRSCDPADRRGETPPDGAQENGAVQGDNGPGHVWAAKEAAAAGREMARGFMKRWTQTLVQSLVDAR